MEKINKEKLIKDFLRYMASKHIYLRSVSASVPLNTEIETYSAGDKIVEDWIKNFISL